MNRQYPIRFTMEPRINLSKVVGIRGQQNRQDVAVIHLLKKGARIEIDSLSIGLRPNLNLERYNGNVVAPNNRWVHELRSEERRVGKESRSRWSPYH